jgi:hypothetical protein
MGWAKEERRGHSRWKHPTMGVREITYSRDDKGGISQWCVLLLSGGGTVTLPIEMAEQAFMEGVVSMVVEVQAPKESSK